MEAEMEYMRFGNNSRNPVIRRRDTNKVAERSNFATGPIKNWFEVFNIGFLVVVIDIEDVEIFRHGVLSTGEIVIPLYKQFHR